MRSSHLINYHYDTLEQYLKQLYLPQKVHPPLRFGPVGITDDDKIVKIRAAIVHHIPIACTDSILYDQEVCIQISDFTTFLYSLPQANRDILISYIYGESIKSIACQHAGNCHTIKSLIRNILMQR